MFLRKYKSALIYILFAVVMLLVLNPFSETNINNHSLRYVDICNMDGNMFTVNTANGDSIEQTFVLHNTEKMDYMDVYIDSSVIGSSDITNYFDICLLAGDKKHVITSDNCTVLPDQNILRIAVGHIYDNANHFIENISVRFVCKSDNATGIFVSNSMDSSFRLNGNSLNRSLLIRGVVKGSSLVYVVLCSAVFLFGFICCLVCNRINAKSFACASLLFGILYILTIPYPSFYEKQSILHIFNYMHNPGFTISDTAWLPSRIVNPVTYQSVPFYIFNNDYSLFSLDCFINLPLVEWIYVPLTLLCSSLSLSNVLTAVLLRTFTLIVCFALNLSAVCKARSNKLIIYTFSLLPFVTGLFVTVSSLGIIVSAFNLFIALLFNHITISTDEYNGISKPSQIILFILLFVISVNNLFLGLIALIALFYIKKVNHRFIWACSIAFCSTVGLCVYLLSINKSFYNPAFSIMNTRFEELCSHPVDAIKAAANSIWTALCNVATGSFIGFPKVFPAFLIGAAASLLLCLYYSSGAIFKPDGNSVVRPKVSYSLILSVLALSVVFISFMTLLGQSPVLMLLAVLTPVLGLLTSSFNTNAMDRAEPKLVHALLLLMMILLTFCSLYSLVHT